jgi:uncharacterized protein YcfL
MNKRTFFKLCISSITVACVLNQSVFAQESKESKLRRSGPVSNIKLTDLRAVVRNGLLTVQASLENASSRNTPVNYRFKWLDNDKMKVTDDQSWQPLTFFAGQTVDLVGVAPTPLATDFIIELNGTN